MGLGAIVTVTVVGTGGYMLIEGWSFLDALYMTVTTISTVGFKEVNPLSTAGMIFTVALILGGVGTILYGLGSMVEFVVKGELSGMFRRRAVKKQVDKLEGHYIVCGYGRSGSRSPAILPLMTRRCDHRHRRSCPGTGRGRRVPRGGRRCHKR